MVSTHLQTATTIYHVTLVIYAFFFVLFLRFFFWKYYAETNYWRRRPDLSLQKIQDLARERQQELPFISVFVPARNEADVIARTIEHMAKLDYPKDRYEVIVVTDEKEMIAREKDRAANIEATVDALQRHGNGHASGHGNGHGDFGPAVQTLLLGLVTHICLSEGSEADGAYTELLAQAHLTALPRRKREFLVRDLARELVARHGHIGLNWLFKQIRRNIPGLTEDGVREVYPFYLAVAIPIVSAYYRLRGTPSHQTIRNMIVQTAHAHHKVTRQILSSMTTIVSQRILIRIEKLRRRHLLTTVLDEIYADCFPTTQDIVEAEQREMAGNPAYPALKHACVPEDFDGYYLGRRTGHPVPSTKGRALNWAMPSMDQRTTVCGFYDAESRPEAKVLQYVAYRRLLDGDKVKILQGPVFQVRNFYEMNALSKIACLYQALAHDWYLPALFRRLPFVGGTNLFMDRRLLEEIGGYDHHILTEDLELGARAYLESGAWPEYLPYVSSEQTPPTVKSFYRQRLRWGVGHLQVMDKIRADRKWDPRRKRTLLHRLFVKGQLEWVLYQSATFVPPTVMILWALGYADPRVVPITMRWVLNGISMVYIVFTIYAFFRYSQHVDTTARPASPLGYVGVASNILLLPIVSLFFPVPYSSAMVLKGLNRHPRIWVKTMRTRE